ncbi:MAG: hypothetical protein WBB07_27360, partial [Mycobacterium sp.]
MPARTPALFETTGRVLSLDQIPMFGRFCGRRLGGLVVHSAVFIHNPTITDWLSNMRANTVVVMDPMTTRTEVLDALAGVDAAQARLRATSTNLVGNAFRIEIAERLETQ